MDENFVWKVLLQLVLAVRECHQRKDGGHVLHRDLKPANVFLDANNNVKLGDFGLARVLMHETSFAKTFVGTPYYMSPVSLFLSISYEILSSQVEVLNFCLEQIMCFGIVIKGQVKDEISPREKI